MEQSNFDGGAEDPGADTAMFRAFVDKRGDDRETTRRSGDRFRLLTLLAGVIALVIIAWALVRL